MKPFQKIKIKSNGYPGGTQIELNDNPVTFAQEIGFRAATRDFTTVSLLVVGEVEVDTEGIVIFHTRDNRKFHVVEELFK